MLDIETASWGEEVTHKYDMVTFIIYGKYYIASIDGKDVGVLITVRTDSGLFVTDLAVLPDYRNMRVAKALGNYLKTDIPSEWDIEAWVHSENAPSIACALKCGCQIVGTIWDPYCDGEKENYLIIKG